MGDRRDAIRFAIEGAYDADDAGSVHGEAFEALDALLAERAALREQLDAARQGLERAENDAAFFFNVADGVELKPEVRRAVAGGTLRAVRAALVVEGPRQPDPWVVIEWLAENNPAALELCPYKVRRG